MGYAVLIIVGFLLFGLFTGSIELPDDFYQNSVTDSDDDDDFYRNFNRDSDYWD